MDKLLALNMFVETVRCGGYSAAARKLGVATSSVTRQVAALEAELGAALLNRSTRHSSPTEAGQAYFENALAILDALEAADNAIADRDGTARGRMRISVPVEFGRRVIAPRLGRLLDRHPELEVSLNLSDTMTDLFKDRVDLAVRLGTTVFNDELICKPIGHFERWIVASPEYLQRTAHPEYPQDLLEHACLRFDYGNAHKNWLFRHGDEAITVDVRGRLQSNNADILRERALAGEGVAMLADWLVAEDVRQGRLTRILPAYDVNPGTADSSINVLYLPNHRGSTRVKAFVDFLDETWRSITWR
ncbi:LysR family transcriptional regulator [Pseudomonas sp. RIT-PI-S]|uniref:LysR family transcriptional regulator n=1 Tax=Pseudomonas sp. RIT-PI-S TaxID=3035295 RepID=UPI0021DA26B5|nr:LysR family transcriptional regulator [Pseudomonas sp. RIT-PI-S]